MSEENKNIENELPTEEEIEKDNAEKDNSAADEKITYEEAQKYSVVFGEEDDAAKMPPEKKRKKISLSAFFLSAVAIVLVSVMMTWSLCMGLYRRQLANITQNGMVGGAPSGEIDLIASILNTYSYFDLEEEEMLEEAIKAYVAATGDRYAAYMNAEEFESFNASMTGNTVGIGINVIESSVRIDGADYKVYKIINVTKDSPAQEAGVLAGDLVAYIGTDVATRESIDSLGYENAFAKMLGEEGTRLELTLLRKKAGSADQYGEIAISAERKKIVMSSVYSHVCETDNSVGIVKITGFDYNTPAQFSEAVDALREKGIEKIVFDLRYNGGGALISVVAILSYFLDEGDTIISTKSKNKEPEVIKAGVVSGYKGSMASCNVSKSDIGKYKDLKVAVLCNESTASAAELFTANFRDYELGKTVGTKTFGKGAMQSTLDLSYFGYEGGIKLTTDMYFPPCGESYDGIGITPDVEVALDESLIGKNVFDIKDAEDNQLQAAINTFVK